MPQRLIAVPARLSGGEGGDPRIAGANRIFHDVVALVRSCGLDPVVITHPNTRLDSFDGLVLPGGGDLDPALYGGAPCSALYDVNPDQDALDLSLARRALELDLPILGICRGAQVLNVAAGGTLFADLAPTDVQHRAVVEPDGGASFSWHPITVEPGTRLHAALGGRTALRVASGHHQGIADLASRFRLAAAAADGLTEAFEDQHGRQIGVQWHPEAGSVPGAEIDAVFIAFARVVTGEEARARRFGAERPTTRRTMASPG